MTSNAMTSTSMPAREPRRAGRTSSLSSSTLGERILSVSNVASSLGAIRTRPANFGSSGIAASLPTYGPEDGSPDAAGATPSVAHAAVARLPSGGGTGGGGGVGPERFGGGGGGVVRA